jgi:hypothetical protein
MAEHCVDPTWLWVVSTQLARSSTAALDASHELLAHYGDTGDAATQSAVDTLVNRAADALGALNDSLADTSLALQQAGQRAAISQAADSRAIPSRAIPSRATPSRHVQNDDSSARATRIRDQGT